MKTPAKRFQAKSASNEKLPAGAGGGMIGKARQWSIGPRGGQSGGDVNLTLC
jgi:hypothetical protein